MSNGNDTFKMVNKNNFWEIINDNSKDTLYT